MLSGALKRFVLDSPHASADTKKATQRAVDLFLQAFGDAPVSIIGGEKAGAFRDLLFSLPASLAAASVVFHFWMNRNFRSMETWDL
ncbi:hypothetical protein ATR01nite_25180 [Acetobacter tropicalis]|uniref:Uncharacterized protein n=1 Tax=Acetobacter tropicalis TaxID=104102 RepID=A0A511FR60_9PROT|nr:hypothetical protein ATR01nite_25180 [Acetobacter tropicalis]